MRDLKYLAAYSIPTVAFLSVYFKGWFTFATIIYAFGLIPLLEILFSTDTSNLSEEAVKLKRNQWLFDGLLYLNLPMVYGLLFYALFSATSINLKPYEFVGLVLTTGTVLGVNGINVGHELGHRQASKVRFIGKALLLPSLYMHFYIEHNFGHHLHVATKEDPATARYNQSVYSFWFTSIIRQYLSAWKIQKRLLKNYNLSLFSVYDDMLWYLVFQGIYLILIVSFFGNTGLLFVISSAIIGVLLLETVNYIEHYGLLRLKTKSGRYERVAEKHSWNSNHVIGRIVLYELTRHSDHHYKSSKKYQILDCHEESPQMPFGYPTSMVIALFPPLWFKIMNWRVPREMIV